MHKQDTAPGHAVSRRRKAQAAAPEENIRQILASRNSISGPEDRMSDSVAIAAVADPRALGLGQGFGLRLTLSQIAEERIHQLR